MEKQWPTWFYEQKLYNGETKVHASFCIHWLFLFPMRFFISIMKINQTVKSRTTVICRNKAPFLSPISSNKSFPGRQLWAVQKGSYSGISLLGSKWVFWTFKLSGHRKYPLTRWTAESAGFRFRSLNCATSQSTKPKFMKLYKLVQHLIDQVKELFELLIGHTGILGADWLIMLSLYTTRLWTKIPRDTFLAFDWSNFYNFWLITLSNRQ